MGIRTVAIDINDSQLEMAKKAGADTVVNSMTNKNYINEIIRITNKGCHAAAVYSASNAAYAGAPAVLRTGGLVMVIGIAPKGLDFINTFDLTTGRYRVKADSTGIPQRMKKAVDFTGEYKYVVFALWCAKILLIYSSIQPEVDFRKLEDLPEMVESMQAGKAEKRQVVVF